MMRHMATWLAAPVRLAPLAGAGCLACAGEIAMGLWTIWLRAAGLSLAVALGTMLTACAAPDPAPALAGGWTFSQDLGQGFGAYLTWSFAGDRFTLEGYPPLRQEGRFRLIERRDHTYRIQLFAQSGDLPADEREILVVYDPTADTLMIDGQGPYRRAEGAP